MSKARDRYGAFPDIWVYLLTTPVHPLQWVITISSVLLETKVHFDFCCCCDFGLGFLRGCFGLVFFSFVGVCLFVLNIEAINEQ